MRISIIILPYITYGIEVWGSASDCHVKPILVLQNRSIRIITAAHYRGHASPIFKSLKLLPFEDIYEFAIVKMIFKVMKGFTPSTVFLEICSSLITVYMNILLDRVTSYIYQEPEQT